MKKITLFCLSLLCVVFSVAQSPQAFKYQAVARDVSGDLLVEQAVSFRISILESSAAGTAVYVETHPATTNTFGLVNLEIGNGTVESGVFADISWGSASYFLQVEMDEAGGTGYQLMGTSQLLSVPYSMHSATTSDNTRWIKSGIDDLYYLNGKVGIGTETPSGNLEIHNNTAAQTRFKLSSFDYSKSIFFTSGSATFDPGIYFEGGSALRFTLYEAGVGYTELMRIQADGDIGLGTESPDEAAILELNSNSRGFLPPRMTTSERLAIPNPPEGLMIYNTDKKTIEFFDGNYWRMPSSPPGASPAFVCGDNFLDTRNEKMYNTVMIGDQCWMAENLNIGTLIPGSGDQMDNSEIEKYCYGNLETNCEQFGGLYQWEEMMQYVTTEGVQGICPDGWHVPSDAELCTLTSFIDSSVDCNSAGWTGTDAGTKMKSVNLWSPGVNGNNEFGFNSIPGGQRDDNGFFFLLSFNAFYWSSTEQNEFSAWERKLDYNFTSVSRISRDKDYSFNVRCTRGDFVPVNSPPQSPINPSPSDGSIDMGLNTTLSWACTDPDGDPLTYDVYFGTSSSPPLMVSGQSETTYDPGALLNETTYFWKVMAHDNAGNSTEGSEWSFTTAPSAPVCPASFIDDRDGQEYAAIQIGTQCWMAENLNIGDQIPGGNTQIDNGTVEKYCYDDLESNCDAFGGLYRWDEMMEYSLTEPAQGICPAGWHLPTDAEWCILTQEIDPTVDCGVIGYTGTDVGSKMKSTTGWISGGNGTNESGFTALPGGYRFSFAAFDYLGDYATFWSSTGDGSYVWYRLLTSSSANVFRNTYDEHYCYSVRCIKD